MDFHRLRDGRLVLQNFVANLRTYRPRDLLAQRTDSQVKVLRGMGTLFVAVLLALLTQASIEERSVQKYLTEQWPTSEMWTSYLSAKGYGLVQRPSDQSRWLRTFTPDLEAKPEVWTSADGCLIYLQAVAGDQIPEQLWACGAPPDGPVQWTSSGSGWLAFQKIAPPPRKASKPSNKLSNPIDPLEIRY